MGLAGELDVELAGLMDLDDLLDLLDLMNALVTLDAMARVNESVELGQDARQGKGARWQLVRMKPLDSKDWLRSLDSQEPVGPSTNHQLTPRPVRSMEQHFRSRELAELFPSARAPIPSEASTRSSGK